MGLLYLLLGTENGDREANIKISRAIVVDNQHTKGIFGNQASWGT
jgi:hypothetical protein